MAKAVQLKAEADADHLEFEDSRAGASAPSSQVCGSRSPAVRVFSALVQSTFLWYSDKDKECEYRYFAFVPRVARLSCLLYASAAVYVVTVAAHAIYLAPSNGNSVVTICLRLSLALLAFIVGALLRFLRMSPLTATLAIVLLLMLLGLLPEYLAAGSSLEETFEQSIACLVGYAVLVPTLQLRHIAIGMLTLTVLHVIHAASQNLNFLVMRAITKDLLLNAVGLALAFAAEAQHRINFSRAKQFLEEEETMVGVRDDMHRLLLNTFPAPVVRAIASGQTEVAHRYENVTVLQADLSGFTPLSATKSPEELLSLMSDLFSLFDEIAEQHGVHKLKTIGDAYVACAGAFGEGDGGGAFGDAGGPAADPKKAARRTARMGLAMAQAVAKVAADQGIKVTARIGIHTGMVIGGIIGTVRFHFDMWGDGVRGAMHLEELGQAQRVHASNTTAALLGSAFEVVHAQTYDEEHVQKYGIASSVFIERERPRTVSKDHAAAPATATPGGQPPPKARFSIMQKLGSKVSSSSMGSSGGDSTNGTTTGGKSRATSSDELAATAGGDEAMSLPRYDPLAHAVDHTSSLDLDLDDDEQITPESSPPATVSALGAPPASLLPPQTASAKKRRSMTTGGLPPEFGGASLGHNERIEGEPAGEGPSARLIAARRSRNLSVAPSSTKGGVDSVLLQAVLRAAGEPLANDVLDQTEQTRLNWRMGAWKARRASKAGQDLGGDIEQAKTAAEALDTMDEEEEEEEADESDEDDDDEEEEEAAAAGGKQRWEETQFASFLDAHVGIGQRPASGRGAFMSRLSVFHPRGSSQPSAAAEGFMMERLSAKAGAGAGQAATAGGGDAGTTPAARAKRLSAKTAKGARSVRNFMASRREEEEEDLGSEREAPPAAVRSLSSPRAGAASRESEMAIEPTITRARTSVAFRHDGIEAAPLEGGTGEGRATSRGQPMRRKKKSNANRAGRDKRIKDGNFFVRTEKVGDDKSLELAEVAMEKEEKEKIFETHRSLQKRAECLLAVVILAGPYEATTFYQAVLIGGWDHLAPLLVVRYIVLAPLLVALIAYLRATTPTSRADNKIAAGLLIALPSIALLCVAGLAMDQALVCPRTDDPELIRPCPPGYGGGYVAPLDFPILAFPPSPPPPPPRPPAAPWWPTSPPAANVTESNSSPLLCRVAIHEGVWYCYQPPFDFLSLLGIVHAVFHYSVELGAVLRRQTLIGIVVLLSAGYIAVLAGKMALRYGVSTKEFSSALWAVGVTAAWVALAHVIGLVHYNARRLNLWQHRSLRLRQRRVLKNIELETANCEQLLKNVLPPHLIDRLGSLVARSVSTRAESPGAVQQSPGMVAESFANCTFLFAKVGGLSQLINDPKANPRLVLRLLQTMFDRFDALADTFRVQKVRKTANEYYLVAAGLPNPELLPSTEDRAMRDRRLRLRADQHRTSSSLELEHGFNPSIKVTCVTGRDPLGLGHRGHHRSQDVPVRPLRRRRQHGRAHVLDVASRARESVPGHV